MAALVLRKCAPRKIALDIGANQGVITLFLLEYFSHVYCFEPIPQLSEYLKLRFSECNLTIESCALGDFNGEMNLNIPYVGNQKFETRSSLVSTFDNAYIQNEEVTHVDKVRVKIRKMDDFNFENIGFIKIDVEGFELNVLKGAEKTIQNNKPILYIEIEQRHHAKNSMNDVFKYILDFQYFGYFVYHKKLFPLSEFNIDKMQMCSHEKTDEYVNNFIFSPMQITRIII